jgi:large subunit ribosomal protein L23
VPSDERRGRRERVLTRESVMLPEQIVKRPIILTEKVSRLREDQNQVVFEVARNANKIQIKNAIESLFKVSVTSVNTAVYRGKDKRMGRGYAKLQNWKKAIITLKDGDSIQFFDEEKSE